jgi:hypothetical protein
VLRETHAKELSSLEQDRVRVLDEHKHDLGLPA